MKPVDSITFHKETRTVILESRDNKISLIIPGMKNPIYFKEFSKFALTGKNAIAFYRKGNRNTPFHLKMIRDNSKLLQFIVKKVKEKVTEIKIPESYMLSKEDITIEGTLGSNFSNLLASKNILTNAQAREAFRIFKITNSELDYLKENKIPERLNHRIFLQYCAEILGKPDSFCGSPFLFWVLLAKK